MFILHMHRDYGASVCKNSSPEQKVTIQKRLAIEFHEYKLKYLKGEYDMKMKILQVEREMKIKEREMQLLCYSIFAPLEGSRT